VKKNTDKNFRQGDLSRVTKTRDRTGKTIIRGKMRLGRMKENGWEKRKEVHTVDLFISIRFYIYFITNTNRNSRKIPVRKNYVTIFLHFSFFRLARLTGPNRFSVL